MRDKRTGIKVEDILEALVELELGDLVPQLRADVEAFEASLKARKEAKKSSGDAAEAGDDDGDGGAEADEDGGDVGGGGGGEGGDMLEPADAHEAGEQP